MFNTHPNKRKQWPYKRDGDGYTISSSRLNHNLSPEQVAELMLRRPELRLTDNPTNVQLSQILVATPEDFYAQELFQLIARDGLRKAIVADDEFWGNYPPKGSISYPSDFRTLAKMPTGDPTGIADSQMTGNLGFLGITRSGKTSNLMCLLSYREMLKSIGVVAFVKKRELRHLVTLPRLSELIVTFKIEELKLSLFQPPPCVPEQIWCNEVTRIFAHSYGRYSAQRLMGQILINLMANRPKGTYPTIRQLAKEINEFRPRFGMREAAYKESILWCITDLLNCTGCIWDYSYSNFLEHLYSEAGLRIIEAEALAQEHLTFIATYFMRWLYMKRIYAGEYCK
jgi:hypothetical protein